MNVDTEGKANKEILKRLENELELIKQRVGMGWELGIKWCPGEAKLLRGQRLQGQVKGDLIIIYVEDEEDALDVLRHEFVEWILNRHSRPWRRLVNRLIEAYEDQQYDQKEPIADALAKLLVLETHQMERRD